MKIEEAILAAVFMHNNTKGKCDAAASFLASLRANGWDVVAVPHQWSDLELQRELHRRAMLKLGDQMKCITVHRDAAQGDEP